MKNKIDKLQYQNEWTEWIGKDVSKHSGKKFKGGKIIEKVHEFTINPYSQKPAFLLSDNSIVDCIQLKLA